MDVKWGGGGSNGCRVRRVLLAQMAHNRGLAVIAVDPAYTSRWGGEQRIAAGELPPEHPPPGVHPGTADPARPRQPPPWRKTATAARDHPPDQAAHDRSGPPDSQDYVLLSR